MEKIEQKENTPTIETVRVAIFHKGKFLLLQKSGDSKNPNSLEFPGGKIDDIKDDKSTIKEQIETVKKETKEETGIDIDNFELKKVEDFEIYFEAGENKKKFKRKVHLFLVKIPDDKDLEIKINQTLTDFGKSEDNHQSFKWLTREELKNKILSIENGSRPVARNSRHIKKLLQN